MTVAIKVPSVGESITEGTIAHWHKKSGDVDREEEPLFELETEKATTTVPAPATGQLKIAAQEGQTVALGAVIGEIDDSVTAPAADKEAAPAPAAEPPTDENPAARAP